MESILQALMNGVGDDGFDFHRFLEAGPDNLIELGFGFTKVGDLVSDIFFITAMNANLDYINFSDFGLYISACVFTSVGILFDLYKVMYFVKQRWYFEQQWCCKWCCCNEEGSSGGCSCNEKGSRSGEETRDEEGSSGEESTQSQRKRASSDWKCWKRSNFVFEEMPQLIIALAYVIYFSNHYFDCAEDASCEDAYYDAKSSAIVSVLFTVASLSFAVVTYCRHHRSNDNDDSAIQMNQVS
jgi:hypothetical protein